MKHSFKTKQTPEGYILDFNSGSSLTCIMYISPLRLNFPSTNKDDNIICREICIKDEIK